MCWTNVIFLYHCDDFVEQLWNKLRKGLKIPSQGIVPLWGVSIFSKYWFIYQSWSRKLLNWRCSKCWCSIYAIYLSTFARPMWFHSNLSLKFWLLLTTSIFRVYSKLEFPTKKVSFQGCWYKKKFHFRYCKMWTWYCVKFFLGAFSSICEKLIGILPVQRHFNMEGLCVCCWPRK